MVTQTFEQDLISGSTAALGGAGLRFLDRWQQNRIPNQTSNTLIRTAIPGGLGLLGLGLMVAAPAELEPVAKGAFHAGASTLGWHLTRIFLPQNPAARAPAPAIQRAPLQRAAPALPAVPAGPIPALPPGRSQQPQPAWGQQAQPIHQVPEADYSGMPKNPKAVLPRVGPRPVPEGRAHADAIGRSWGGFGGAAGPGQPPQVSVTGVNPATGEQILFSQV